MKPYWPVLFLGFGMCAAGVQADATLVYTLTDGTAGSVEKKISLTRFFARVDSSDRPDEYLLYQAGKFFPLYRVDTVARNYTLLSSSVDPTGLAAKAEASHAPAAGEGADDATSEMANHVGEPLAAPPRDAAAAAGVMPAEAPEAQFKPTRNMDSVAGVRCRVVTELEDGAPVIEHCMANKAGLGITERETRTLARLFVQARRLDWGWLGAATSDEDFVSVRSRDPDNARTLELLSFSRSPLATGYMKLPSDFEAVGAATSDRIPPPPPTAPAD